MSHMLTKIHACDVCIAILQLAKSPFWGPKPRRNPLVYASAIWRAQDLSLIGVPLLSRLLTGAAFPTNLLLTLWP